MYSRRLVARPSQQQHLVEDGLEDLAAQLAASLLAHFPFVGMKGDSEEVKMAPGAASMANRFTGLPKLVSCKVVRRQFLGT
jgi:hypothetical protein